MKSLILIAVMFLLPVNGRAEDYPKRKGWEIYMSLGYYCTGECKQYLCLFNEGQKEAYCIEYKDQPKTSDPIEPQYYNVDPAGNLDALPVKDQPAEEAKQYIYPTTKIDAEGNDVKSEESKIQGYQFLCESYKEMLLSDKFEPNENVVIFNMAVKYCSRYEREESKIQEYQYYPKLAGGRKWCCPDGVTDKECAVCNEPSAVFTQPEYEEKVK